MDRCPKCHSMLFGNVNFCSCGKFHYDPREVGRHPNPPRRGRYLVYRKGFDANDDGVKFDLTPPPPELPAKKEEVPGWMWRARLRKKRSALAEREMDLRLASVADPMDKLKIMAEALNG